MASPRIKNDYQEVTLVFSRILAFVAVIVVVGLTAWVIAMVAGAPWGFASAIGGSVAGLVGFFMLICSSPFDIKVFTCPQCNHTDRTLQDIGYYNCHNCGTLYHISDGEVNTLQA